MEPLEYIESDQKDLDLIAPLWQKLYDFHRPILSSFDDSRVTFDKRKEELVEKAKGGAFRLDLVRNVTSGKYVAYGISTVTRDHRGEIDSLYVDEGYRNLGIGGCLVMRSLAWMDLMGAKVRSVQAAAGNWKALEFYCRYGFAPRFVVMEQKLRK